MSKKKKSYFIDSGRDVDEFSIGLLPSHGFDLPPQGAVEGGHQRGLAGTVGANDAVETGP